LVRREAVFGVFSQSLIQLIGGRESIDPSPSIMIFSETDHPSLKVYADIVSGDR
jgi:hypothetical protein